MAPEGSLRGEGPLERIAQSAPAAAACGAVYPRVLDGVLEVRVETRADLQQPRPLGLQRAQVVLRAQYEFECACVPVRQSSADSSIFAEADVNLHEFLGGTGGEQQVFA